MVSDTLETSYVLDVRIRIGVQSVEFIEGLFELGFPTLDLSKRLLFAFDRVQALQGLGVGQGCTCIGYHGVDEARLKLVRDPRR